MEPKNQMLIYTEKEEGWIIECIIEQIISIKNHTNWLIPIDTRVCILGIQHNSVRLFMAVLVA